MDILTAVQYDDFRPRTQSEWCKEYVELMNLCWARDPLDRPTATVVLQKLKVVITSTQISTSYHPLFFFIYMIQNLPVDIGSSNNYTLAVIDF